MDLAGRLDHRSFPWRTAALVAGGVAVAELAGLLALAGVRLAPSVHGSSSPPAATVVSRPAAAKHPAAATHRARKTATAKPQPLRPRSRVSVLVLNGNGVTGVAGAEAQRLLSHGYRSATSTNAPNHSYQHSLVLFRPGYEREGKRLARELGVKIVGPMDGLRPSQVRGSQLVVILGDS